MYSVVYYQVDPTNIEKSLLPIHWHTQRWSSRFLSRHQQVIIGSTLLGGAFVLAGWPGNTLVAKILKAFVLER